MKKMLLVLIFMVLTSLVVGERNPSYGQICNGYPSLGEQCPQWICGAIPPNAPPEFVPDACYSVTLAEMGNFDSAGVFQYDSQYLTDMASWGPDNAYRLPDAWRPVQEIVFSNVSPPRLESIFSGDSCPATRVTFDQPIRAALYPEVYRWTKDGNHMAFVASFTNIPIPGATGCPNATGECTYPAFNKKDIIGQVSLGEINSIWWNDKSKYSNSPKLISMNEINVTYDNTQPPYASPNFSPIYQQYNFWNSPVSPQNPNVSKIMAWWPGLIPDPNTETNLWVKIGQKNYQLTFAGGDTSNIPPIVPLTSVITGQDTKNGKVKDKFVSVTIENLLVSQETNGDLVIQWLAPTVSTPYMQLSVYVGKPWTIGTIPSSFWYALISAPPQSSTVVLPKASWDAVKTALQASMAQVQIYYEHRYFKYIPGSKTTPMGTMFLIRGASEKVEIPY